jgi:hypothetical protein
MSETRNLINHLFREILFSYTDTNNGYDLFVARLPGDFLNKRDYVIALVRSGRRSRDDVHLDEIDWVNLQTRKLATNDVTDNYRRLAPQKWNLPPPSPQVNPPLLLKERRDRATEYTLPDGSEVTLLHDITKNTRFQYEANMKLIQALLKMNCTIVPKVYHAPQPTIQWV